MEILVADRESASLDGSAFGQEVAARTAESMTVAGLTDGELHDIGLRAVAIIVARAEALMASGLEQELAEAWLRSAADAFRMEIEGAVRALLGRDARH